MAFLFDTFGPEWTLFLLVVAGVVMYRFFAPEHPGYKVVNGYRTVNGPHGYYDGSTVMIPADQKTYADSKGFLYATERDAMIADSHHFYYDEAARDDEDVRFPS